MENVRMKQNSKTGCRIAEMEIEAVLAELVPPANRMTLREELLTWKDTE